MNANIKNKIVVLKICLRCFSMWNDIHVLLLSYFLVANHWTIRFHICLFQYCFSTVGTFRKSAQGCSNIHSTFFYISRFKWFCVFYIKNVLLCSCDKCVSRLIKLWLNWNIMPETLDISSPPLSLKPCYNKRQTVKRKINMMAYNCREIVFAFYIGTYLGLIGGLAEN